jgi:hypothetical protein
MVYSSMVHAAGGEGGSIRHDDDGRARLLTRGRASLGQTWLGQPDLIAETTAAMARYAYDQIDQARTELNAVSK